MEEGARRRKIKKKISKASPVNFWRRVSEGVTVLRSATALRGWLIRADWKDSACGDGSGKTCWGETTEISDNACQRRSCPAGGEPRRRRRDKVGLDVKMMVVTAEIEEEEEEKDWKLGKLFGKKKTRSRTEIKAVKVDTSCKSYFT